MPMHNTRIGLVLVLGSWSINRLIVNYTASIQIAPMLISSKQQVLIYQTGTGTGTGTRLNKYPLYSVRRTRLAMARLFLGPEWDDQSINQGSTCPIEQFVSNDWRRHGT